MADIEKIQDGELGLNVRAKLNAAIERSNIVGDVGIRNYHTVTSLTGGSSTALDFYGADLPVGTMVIIGAVIGPDTPGVQWQLKTSKNRPAQGGPVVHVGGNSELYWALIGSGA